MVPGHLGLQQLSLIFFLFVSAIVKQFHQQIMAKMNWCGTHLYGKLYVYINYKQFIVMSPLYTWNSLMKGVPGHLMKKLQHVQNTAVKVVFNLRKYDCLNPVLIMLHWLPVAGLNSKHSWSSLKNLKARQQATAKKWSPHHKLQR